MVAPQSQSNINQLAYQIVFNAQQAIANLDAYFKAVTDAASRTEFLKQTIIAVSNQSKVSLEVARNEVLKLVNVLDEARFAGGSRTQIIPGINDLAPKSAVAASKIDVLTSSLKSLQHVFIGMVAFRLLSFLLNLGQAFNEATKKAQEFYKSLTNVVVGVRQMQRQGLDATISETTKAIQDLKKQFPIFTEADLTSGMDNAISKTRSMQLSLDNVIKLMEISAGMAARTGKSIESTTDAIVNAMINTTAQSTKALAEATYLDVRQADILKSARELGIANAEKGYAAMTKQERAQATLNAAYKQYLQYQDDINSSMNTQANLVTQVDSAWNDYVKDIGSFGLAVKALLSPALLEIIKLLDIFNTAVITNLSIQLAKLMAVIEFLGTGNFKALRDLNTVNARAAEIMKSLLPDAAAFNIGEQFGSNLGSGIVAGLEDSGFSEDALDELGKFEEKVKDLADDIRRELEDARIDLTRKLTDIQTDYEREVVDTNREADLDMEDANRKYRESEIQAEIDYQRKLEQLRDNYLLNLEDALRNRDARQIIRLMKQYKLDKKHAQEEYDDQRAERLRQYQEELADIERHRQEKLRELAIEREQKIQDAKLAFEREREDDLRHNKQKLQDLVDALAEQGLATQAGAEAIRQILNQYFGPGGYTDEIYDYFIQKVLQAASIASGLAKEMGLSTPPSGGGGGGTNPPDHPFANGGTYYAASPTRVLFGEAGPELANFTPLSKLNTHSSVAPSPMNGAELVRVEVLLSPDLEGRVVQAASSRVSTLIRKVQREK